MNIIIVIDLIFANKDFVQIIDTLKYRHAKELKTTSNICNAVVFVRLSNLYIYLTISCKLSKLLFLPTLHYCYCIKDANSFSADIARKKETASRMIVFKRFKNQQVKISLLCLIKILLSTTFTFRIHFAEDSRDLL